MKKIKLSKIQSLLKSGIPKMIKHSNTSDEFHDKLREYLLDMAEEFNVIGKIRYRSSSNRSIDVVWLDETGNIKVAFEIDGGRRKRSIKRLVELTADYKFWFYYGNYNKISDFIKKHDPYNSIEILDMGNIRKKLRGKLSENDSVS